MAPTTAGKDSQTPYGRRLLPVMIDEIAQREPDRLYCVILGLTDGPRTVTMNEFARAINRAARWLEAQVGRSESFETIAYMGPNDIRYSIFLMAGVKVGYKVLLPSLRNSVQNNLHVFAATECKTIFRDSNISVDHILAQRDFHTVIVPGVEELLNGEQVQPYPYTKTFEEAKTDPAVVLHSSGSTGQLQYWRS